MVVFHSSSFPAIGTRSLLLRPGGGGSHESGHFEKRHVMRSGFWKDSHWWAREGAAMFRRDWSNRPAAEAYEGHLGKRLRLAQRFPFRLGHELQHNVLARPEGKLTP